MTTSDISLALQSLAARMPQLPEPLLAAFHPATGFDIGQICSWRHVERDDSYLVLAGVPRKPRLAIVYTVRLYEGRYMVRAGVSFLVHKALAYLEADA